jgi:hypothetical protein
VSPSVGLYVHPPEHALVLSLDEKSQIQALDRTQPGLPMKKGRAATMTHDHKRHGTTTLFAALDVKAGTVIGQRMLRHRAAESIRFLRLIDRQTPPELRQACLKRVSAGCADAQAVSLQAIRRGMVALEDLDFDVVLLQPLRQAKAACSPSNDADPEPFAAHS